ncbi:MAG: methionyl-tRNA formyltransferase [Elusimicrobia bacterium]|nr:methionyl-tRNA formyltransferase [Elusimicrobiota bacterium]
MRLVFYGTPEVAAGYLAFLALGHEIVAVVTQPDKPAGRGLGLAAAPVKRVALGLGLPVFQPQRGADIAGQLGGLGADLGVAVAYGKLLKKDALDLPRIGTLNVHFSLLPKYRGAAPVQWSLARGESATGVSVFWLDEGLDTGPIAKSRSTPIGADEDAAALLERLSAIGRELLAEVLAEVAAGTVRREPQAGQPCPAPAIRREDALIGFGKTAREIHNLVRAMAIWPGAYLELEGRDRPLRLAVGKTAVDDRPRAPGGGVPGTIVAIERGKGFLIECSEGSRLWILSVQPEGKKQMPAVDFLNGMRLGVGGVLRTRGGPGLEAPGI